MEHYEHKLIPLIHSNDISVMVAPIGFGKTTVLPKMLTNYKAIVYCIQPNAFAVRNIYGYMASEDNSVGYELMNENELHCDNKIVYCTCDVVLERLMKDDCTFCSIIMIDDSHYYSIDYELLIYLWLYMYKTCEIPKLFMSLSINDIPYIPVDISNSKYIIPDKKVREKRYHTRNYKFSEKDQLIDDMAEVIHQLDAKHKVVDFSTWLVYVWDMKYAKRLLGMLSGKQFDVTIFNKNLIYNQMNKRLIVIIIDVNTSITLNHVDGVIDSMLEVRDFKNFTGGNKRIFRNISKSTAIQRDGRTNRTKKGFSYRMCTEDFYDMLSKYTPSEMDCADLTDMFLKLRRYELDTHAVLNTKLDKSTIDYYNSLIDDYNLLCNTFFDLNLPLNTLNVIFLHEWTKHELPTLQGIVVACLLDLRKPLCYYTTKLKKEKFAELFNHLGYTILEVYINIYTLFLKEFGDGTFEKTKLRTFCLKHSFNLTAVEQLINKINKIASVLRVHNYEVIIKPFNAAEAIDSAMPILKEVYRDNICVKNKLNYVSKTQLVYSLNVYEHYCPQPPGKYIIVLDSVVVTDNENRNTGRKMITYFISL